MRLFGLALVLLAGFLSAPALAAVERPRLDVLGFSPDGRFFAYRQSGVEEGSQTGYAELFIVDTNDDSCVQGTPLRVRSTAEHGGLSHARALLEYQSARILRRIGLNRALAGVAFMPRERSKMWLDLPWGEHVMLQLSPRASLAAPGCPVSIPIAKGSLRGVHLTLRRNEGVSILHTDRIIPRTRGCALSYRFASGFIKSRGRETVIASLIAYREQTGANSTRIRYMAVTSVIPAPGEL